MFLAALWSRSSSAPQCGQECHLTLRSFWTMHPHPLQACDVPWGATFTTVPPASSALWRHIVTKAPQPASRILLFNPPFAAAPLRTYLPCSSCLGAGAAVILSICKSSETSVLYWFTSLCDCFCKKSRRRLRTLRYRRDNSFLAR